MARREALKRRMAETAAIVAGTAVVAAAYHMFMKPNDLAAPGLGGVAILLGYVVPLPLGVIYFVLNIPLLLLGFRYVGRVFVAYSLLGMMSLSGFLILFSVLAGPVQPLVGAVLGGLLNGSAIATVLAAGGSTGGLDIACVVANKLWPRLTIGRVMVAVNAAVVVLTGLMVDAFHSACTILSIYLAGKTLDVVYAALMLRTGRQPAGQGEDPRAAKGVVKR